MIIMGIDPGTILMGYGFLESNAQDFTAVSFGAIATPKKATPAEKLGHLHRELLLLVDRYQPEVVAIEQPFVAKNVRSAISIGRAQAVAMLAAAERGLPAFEYTPSQVKQRVASHGAASKEQVQEMVRWQLGLSEIPEPNDAADALAVAICHACEAHASSLLEREISGGAL
ncbi:crossover junction endodeoxyribonuclease RuvC [Chloroflexota bacterium]